MRVPSVFGGLGSDQGVTLWGSRHYKDLDCSSPEPCTIPAILLLKHRQKAA